MSSPKQNGEGPEESNGASVFDVRGAAEPGAEVRGHRHYSRSSRRSVQRAKHARVGSSQRFASLALHSGCPRTRSCHFRSASRLTTMCAQEPSSSGSPVKDGEDSHGKDGPPQLSDADAAKAAKEQAKQRKYQSPLPQGVPLPVPEHDSLYTYVQRARNISVFSIAFTLACAIVGLIFAWSTNRCEIRGSESRRCGPLVCVQPDACFRPYSRACSLCSSGRGIAGSGMCVQADAHSSAMLRLHDVALRSAADQLKARYMCSVAGEGRGGRGEMRDGDGSLWLHTHAPARHRVVVRMIPRPVRRSVHICSCYSLLRASHAASLVTAARVLPHHFRHGPARSSASREARLHPANPHVQPDAARLATTRPPACSSALLGYALEALVDVWSSVLVLWRFWKDPDGEGSYFLVTRRRESRASVGIAFTFVIIGYVTCWQARPSIAPRLCKGDACATVPAGAPGRDVGENFPN